MVVLNTKTFSELQEEGISDLTAIGFDNSPGTICRLFLSIINNRIAAAYRALSVNHIRAFLSTSDSDALDAIGVLLNCTRNTDESDDDYKYRISQQCLILASSNETAVRLAALSVSGIRNVTLKPYASGAGTFSVLVELTSSATESTVLANVENAIKETVAYGVKYIVTTPTLVYLKLSFKLYFKDGTADADQQSIKYSVRDAIASYINSLAVGEEFLIDQVTQAIMDVSDDILSHQNISFEIDNQKALYVNQNIRWFEKFELSIDDDNLIIS